MTLRRTRPVFSLLTWALDVALAAGCHALPRQTPLDFSEPGWTLRQGQAVWRPKPDASDIAGELLVAMHRDGRSVVQFAKPPLPFVEAQRGTNSWQIQFFALNKKYAGRGRPPSRILWLQLPDGLAGSHTETNWFLTQPCTGAWHFKNLVTEEALDGFLATTKLPQTHRVQPGETLRRIARWYGVTTESIQAVNPGPIDAWLKAGTRINLPPPPSI